MNSSAESSLTSSTITTTPSSVTPASSFVSLLLNEINSQDVHELLEVQRSLLEQLDKTNEKIDGINKLSAKRYLDATRDFGSHAQLLTTMKRDLDLIFKRIRLLKVRLSKKYPEAYSTVLRTSINQTNSIDDEEEDDDTKTSSRSLVKSKTIDCSQFSSSPLTNN